MTREKELISELIRHKQEMQNDFGWNTTLQTALDAAIAALKAEPCEDAVSRKSIKQKLQEHHDFFVNAYGGFSNLPQNDKSRVDEITNCIAMVVNEPPVTPKPRTGKWELTDDEQSYRCSYCKNHWISASEYLDVWKYCPNCGAKMEGVSE